MTLAAGIGTTAWWDYQLAHCWESNGGPAQTRHFMTRLIEHLGAPERASLGEGPTTVLDWGCAMGEGVRVLADAFPRAEVSGMDIAQSAVEAARRRHPGLEFLVTSEGEISRAFDVIVTSNCLEHFADPWSVMQEHLGSCRRFYVALVPYRERPCLEGHQVSFEEQSFPVCMAGWVRLYTRRVAVEPRYWHGEQLLAVYGSASYLETRAVDETQPERWWPAYLGAEPGARSLIDHIALQQALAGSRAGDDVVSLRVIERVCELTSLRVELRAIAATRAWRLAHALWRWRRRLAPPRTWRDRTLQRLLGTVAPPLAG